MFFGTDEWEELAGAGDADAVAATGPSSTSTTRSTSSTRSGTTGFPKGATLTHHNILNNALLRRRAAAATPSATGCASPCRCTTASGW